MARKNVSKTYTNEDRKFAEGNPGKPKCAPELAEIAGIAGHDPQYPKIPDLDAFEERASICEFDGGLTCADTEQLAAQGRGYENVVAFRGAQQTIQKGNANDTSTT